MDYNGMTEEEYLDSLLRQASDDIPKENTAEQTLEESEPEIPELEASESEEQEAVFDFDDIFGVLAEVETTSAESVSEETNEDEQVTEEYVVEHEEADFLEDLFAQMESEMENVSLEEESTLKEEPVVEEPTMPEEEPALNEATVDEESAFEDIASLFENVAGFDEDVSAAEELFTTESREELSEPEDNQDFSDFHRSLDSIIGELEKDRDDSESDEIDIFSQIDNAELSEDEMSQEIDDMSLLEAVGMLLDEEEKANEKQEFDGLFDLTFLYIPTLEIMFSNINF